VAAGLALSCGSAFAQVEEIIVTAEFREADVQDTPIAITAISGDLLEARSQTNVFEISSQAPNVTLKPGGPARSGMMAYIRGIGQSDFIAAVEPGVGMYVDDVYYAQLTGSLLDLLDLDRVEILRGPQGTLAGRNSIGGAIKLYSNKPGSSGDEGGGSLKVGYGKFNAVDIRGTADLTLFEDKLYARIAGAARSRDGYIDVLDYACTHPGSGLPQNRAADDCRVDRVGNQVYATGRAQLRWLVNDDLEINFAGDYLNDQSGHPAGTLLWADRTAIENAGAATNMRANPIIAWDDGDPATAPVLYRNHIFVPYGPFHNPNDPINDPYVNYMTLHDPGEGPSWSALDANGLPIVDVDANGRVIMDRGAITGVNAVTGEPTRVPVTTLPTRFPSRNYIKQWGISANIQWQLNEDFSFQSITAYREYDTWMTWDSDYSPLAVTQLDNRLDNWQFTQELRLNGTTGPFDYTLGGYYLDQNSHYEARVMLPYAAIDFIHGPDPTPATTWAVFGHATWHVFERLNLSAGLRYSDEAKDYTHHRHNPDGTLPATAPGPQQPGFGPFPVNVRVAGLDGLTAEFRDTRVDWRVALDFALTDNVMAYGSVATGYKGGGVNPRPFFPVQLETFDAETLTSYELGFKSTLFDRSVRLNGAVFYTDYEDIQLNLNACARPSPPFPTNFGAPCAKPTNVGNAEIWGIETEAEWYVTDNFSIDGAVSWLDFEYTEITGGALSGGAIDPLDMVTPYTPEWKWSIGGQYRFDLGGNGALFLRMDAAYQDDVFSNPQNTPLDVIEDYTLVNLRAWWQSSDDDWTVALDIQNLTDELYYYTYFNQETSVGQIVGQPGLPLTWNVSVQRRF
jgi:iron complex outermembrane receptor protein